MTRMSVDRVQRELARHLANSGVVSGPAWAEVVTAVPRHRYLTRFAAAATGPWHDLRADGGDVGAALELLYSDAVLHVPFGRRRGESVLVPAPSTTAGMLQLLAPQRGERILQLGTDGGWSAAVLARLVGFGEVVSLDSDPVRAFAAAVPDRRATTRVRAVCAPVTGGYPQFGPYDRIVGSVTSTRVPAAWVQQARPDGVIVAGLAGALIRLVVDDDTGVAFGRFTAPDWLGPLPTVAADPHSAERVLAASEGPADRPARRAPWDVEVLAPEVRFLRTLVLPTLHTAVTTVDGTRELRIVDSESASWARVQYAGGAAVVYEDGPRRLWDELVVVAAAWNQQGRPTLDRYGLTVTPTGRHVLWLDTPNATIIRL